MRDKNKPYEHEADLTKAVKAWLTDLKKSGERIHFWKASDRYHPGISDILCCYKGKFLAIELKAEDGEPSVHQLQFLKEIALAGGEVLVCRTISELEEFFKKF
jgi:hypothetical protein